MTKQQHETHVWVQTEVVEAILQNDGTLPQNYKPSRKRSRAGSKLSWGWARALVSTSISSSSEHDITNTHTSSAILQRVKSSPGSPTRHRKSSSSSNVLSNTQPVMVTLLDTEFAPDHLYNATVMMDPTFLQMANHWSSHHPPEDLTLLTHLHEPAVVYCLQQRYTRKRRFIPYTGKILLALNPFC